MMSRIQFAPLVRSWQHTQLMMLLTFVALLPMFLFSIVRTGGLYGQMMPNFIGMIGFSALWELVMNGLYRRWTILDGSILVSAMIVGLCLPPSMPWMALAQISFFMVVVAKWALGGLGFGYLNPAMLGYLFALLAWPELTHPLAYLQPNSLAHGAFWQVGGLQYGVNGLDYLPLLLGFIILAGARISDWRVTLACLVGYGWISVLLLEMNGPWWQVFSLRDNLAIFFVAIYVAPNPGNLPTRARMAYGMLMGILIVILQARGLAAASVPLGVLLANICAPVLSYYSMSMRHRSISAEARG
jgi:Na+-translocating ferredoxin:NAD+ oxidoreductase subunit D